MSDIDNLSFKISKSVKNRLNSDTISKLNIQIENKKRILADLKINNDIIKKSLDRNNEDLSLLEKISEINQSRISKTKKLNDKISKIENILLGQTNDTTVENNFNINNDIQNIKNIIEKEKNKLLKLEEQINEIENEIKILNDKVKETNEIHDEEIKVMEEKEKERLKEEQLKMIFSLSDSKNDIEVNNRKYNLSAKKLFSKDKIISKYFNYNKEISSKEYYTIIEQRNNQKYKYGVIHPTLGKIMDTAKDNQKIPVNIWSLNNKNFNYNKKVSLNE